MSRRGWVLFAALGVIWGVPYLMIKVAVRDFDPVVVAGGRTALGALLLLPVALRGRRLQQAFARWRWLLVYTVVEIVGPWFFLGHAETRLTSSTAGLLLAVVPLMAALILAVTGGERLDLRRGLGLAVGFAGVVALVGLDVHFGDLGAVGLVMLTALGYAIGPIVIARKLSDLPPMGVITGSLLLAAVIYAPFAIWLRPHSITAPAGWSVLGLAVICTALAFLVFFALIDEVGPARATVITYINPAVAVLLGVLVLGEQFTIGMVIGFALVLAGSVLATARSRRPAQPEPEVAAP